MEKFHDSNDPDPGTNQSPIHPGNLKAALES